ncbi:MAG: hypothetical protein A2297_07750 [Elusimicrobia bacterium RIFOXYB2_FULL_48_7]|nr:MAG: hypothetical protein A2297_07750 [Elusimicrobia bacterium RIFOXYB2_FULL_48_7]
MPKRKHLRADSDILVDIFSADAIVNRGRGCVVNISLGGIAIETESALDLGHELLIDMKLPGGTRPIEIHAKVVRQQNMGNLFHYGLKYTRLGLLQRIKLFFYIKR